MIRQIFVNLPVKDLPRATAFFAAAGGTTPNAPVDHGFMVQHGFADLDGHPSEMFWMDERAAPKQM